MRSLALDVGILRRRRDFALLTLGQSASRFGSQFTLVALPVQAYALTRSTVVVGLLGLAELVPLVAFALLGGALADALDRRRLIVAADLGSMAIAGGLAVNAATAHAVWPLFAAAALAAACDALRRPPLDALTPRLVRVEELPAAMAVVSGVWNVAALAGPALAGLVIAAAGYVAAYAVDGATFAVGLVSVLAITAPPVRGEVTAPGLGAIGEAVRYARSRPELIGTYVIDMNAMFFAMPFAIFPAFAHRLGGGAQVAGLLFAAPAAGALIASLLSGWTSRVHRHGRAVALAAAGWGGAIVLFGLAPTLPLALLALAAAGVADEISGIFRSVLWNATIPDALRGRMAGLELVSYSSGPALGDAEAGAAAALIGLRRSVVAGGVLCVVGGAAITAALPAFWAYDSRMTASPTAIMPGVTVEP